MRIGQAWLADLLRNHIEEFEAVPCRYEAVRPAAHKIRVVKFVLRANVSTHCQFSAVNWYSRNSFASEARIAAENFVFGYMFDDDSLVALSDIMADRRFNF